jgi:lipopolysaccharide transport system ATP-binding protein
MSNVAIRVENLGKQFQIGATQAPYRTIRESINDWVASPFRRLGRVLRGDGYGASELNETIWALRDVSFEVQHGEVLGIIGHNGAGKSTLLKILSRITEPSEGFVDIYGRVGALLEVGTGFHPELTGRENVYLNAAILGMKRHEIDRKFDEIVDFAGVEKFIDTPVKHYSSGMGLRLGFAVAAHLEPEILVVDEVLAVGDAAFQKKCLGKMSEVAGEGRTVLFVSHNMGAVRHLCSKGLILRSGNLLDSGDVDTVINKYLIGEKEASENIIRLPVRPNDIGQGISLQFLNAVGEPQYNFRMGELIKIRVLFEIHKSVKQVIAALGIVTVDGVPIASVWSEAQDLIHGLYTTDFDIKFPLSSTILTCVVGLSSYEQTFYYVEQQGQIVISDASLDDQPLRAKGAGILFDSQRPAIKKSV